MHQVCIQRGFLKPLSSGIPKLRFFILNLFSKVRRLVEFH